jgi:predicted Fe-S protein YdhL (DUF1289 family)
VHGADVGSRCLTLSDIRLRIVIEAWNRLDEQIQLAILQLIETRQREAEAAAGLDR